MIEKDEMIARQAIKIAELEELVASYKKDHRKIHMQLYAIGAPLNDNVLCYTKEQLAPFFAIANLLDSGF